MKCACGERATVRILTDDSLVCWHCYNRLVRDQLKPVRAQPLRKHYR